MPLAEPRESTLQRESFVTPRAYTPHGRFQYRSKRADIGGVKAILTVVVYVFFVLSLGVVTALTLGRDDYARDAGDDDL